jgi:hypothetical protein
LREIRREKWAKNTAFQVTHRKRGVSIFLYYKWDLLLKVNCAKLGILLRVRGQCHQLKQGAGFHAPHGNRIKTIE